MAALKQREASLVTVVKHESATLRELCSSILNCSATYSEIALYVENRAYDEWKNGQPGQVIAQLKRIAAFLERPRNKNTETKRELADVYFLIGQICQYSGLHVDSIDWFSRSVYIDDGNPLSYHEIAESYIKTGNVRQATRSFERELALDEGNYFTYLELALIYDRDNNPEKADECLKKLLERDPDNIQGIHCLIRLYEKNNPLVDPKLLMRRLLGIKKRFSWIEAAIRSLYLSRTGRIAEAADFLDVWERDNHPSPVVYCAKASLYALMKLTAARKKEIAHFMSICKDRQEVITGHVEEFRNIFGDKAAEKILAFCFPKTRRSRPGPDHHVGEKNCAIRTIV